MRLTVAFSQPLRLSSAQEYQFLVPASMVLLGDRNWYFPSWLEWLPRVDVEGEQAVEPEDHELVQGTTSPVHPPLAAPQGTGD